MKRNVSIGSLQQPRPTQLATELEESGGILSSATSALDGLDLQ